MNGEDSAYIDLYNQHAKEPQDKNPERFRDVYQLLKYSLRSVEQFAPWINHIYIVTARPQVPDWLNENHPKISVIHHDQIFNREDVPTFNYNVIESYIHKIPGLSEGFIYLNDDFLFGNNVFPQDFYSNDNKVLIHGTLFGENFGWRVFNGKNDVIGLGLIEHSPILIRKEWWEKMQLKRRREIEKVKSNKFRREEDAMMYKLYRWYALKCQSAHCTAINVNDLLKVHTFHKITNNLRKQEVALSKLEKKAPKFYCLNDDQRKNPNHEVIELVKNFLEQYYSGKSELEA